MNTSAPRPSRIDACSANSSIRVSGRSSTSPSGPIEPAMKTSRPVTSRASRASADGRRVDPLELVLEEARAELAAGSRRTCSSRSARRRRGCSRRAPRRRSPARAGSPPPGSAAGAQRPRSTRPCRRRRRSAGLRAGAPRTGSSSHLSRPCLRPFRAPDGRLPKRVKESSVRVDNAGELLVGD